ncbi:MAG TPA: VWA domain-containing protein, partial [Roseiflexaceae bacterium]
AALVAFGANAVVEQAVTSQPSGDLPVPPSAVGTNIQEAVELGLALLPAETNKRLVLLSDGGENAGDARTAARLAAARGVPLSYVDLGPPPGAGEALVSELHAPASVRAGQSFELVATVESSVAQAAHLRILGDGQPVAEQDVQLQPGLNRFPVKVDARGSGFQRYRAEITPQQDLRGENNAAEAQVRVNGAPKVLMVIGRDGDGHELRVALNAAQVAVQPTSPDMLPNDLNQLSAYDAIVLVNVPRSALHAGTMEALQSYVRDLGKGLVMIGGDQTYGVGGYSQTPIEEALPVYMDAPNQVERPNLALVFVLDKSSSMSGCHCRGPDRKQDGYFDSDNPYNLDIAKQGVKQAVAVLDPRDIVSVVMFDENAVMALPPQSGSSPDAVMEAIKKIKPIGSTNIHSGLDLAAQTLGQINASVKHIVLFTDGLSHGGDTIAQAQELHKQGVTLSVVGEGFGAVDYLTQLSQAGGGRYIQVANTQEVPQIFVQEAMNVSSKFVVEKPFTPSYGAESPILAGLDKGLPQLYGYNGTLPKQTATLALADTDGAPILAQWQYGLGRAVAWTSDAKGKWAKDWVAWPEFPRFAAQMVGWVLPTVSGSALSVDIRDQGAQTRIEVTAPEQPGHPRPNMDMRATIVGADGARREVPLAPSAPGVYGATIPSPPQGIYTVQVAGLQGATVVAQETAALVVPYSTEYRLGQSNPALLDALAQVTGGGRLAQPGQAFERAAQGAASAQEIALPLLLLALILLPLDILIRRLAALWRTRPRS